MKTALKKMKPNYKNWMPKGMILETLGGALACLLLFLVFGVSGLLAAGTLKTVLKIVFLVLAIVLALVTLWMWLLHRAFSYNGKRQMSKQIIDGVAAYVTLPECAGHRLRQTQPQGRDVRHRPLGQRICFL